MPACFPAVCSVLGRNIACCPTYYLDSITLMLLTVLRETWYSVACSYFLLVCPPYIWKGPYSEDLKKKS